MIEKPTNPKDSLGIKKAPMSTIPTPPMMEAGLAMMEGALKYGRHNYRTIGVKSSVYYDAALRHLNAWWEGQENAPDSGIHHLAHALACILIVRDSQMIGNLNDDRPPSYPDNWLDELNKKAGELVEKYPNSKAAHTKV